ncbi:MAG: tetratricopeptide repeat protein, partial [Gemmatimonadota bacterium]|nr:tetratricopeptide repeat protein [Gemmatimonadota bacterium]
VKGPRAAAPAMARRSPQSIGDALGVEYLLQSRIRRRDSLVEISLALVESAEGFQLWSGDYHGSTADLLVLQDSIAHDVAAAVAGELSERDRQTLGGRLTSSPVAYDRFLRGKYLLGKRTPASVAEAIREYRTAAEHDGGFAEALAGSAYAHLLFAEWGWEHPEYTAAELVTAAEALVGRAHAIAPESPAVILAQAYARVLRDPYRLEGAVPLFERAIQRDSLDPEAFHQYGQALMVLGRYDEARAAYLRAIELDPARPMTLVPLAAVALQRGALREALQWADSAVAVTRVVAAPYALAVRANVRLNAGDPAAALADARRSLALDSSYPTPALSVVAGALARLGDSAGAERALAKLFATVDPQQPSTTDVRFAASVLLALGRREEALTLIERARPRGALLWFYLQSRDFDPYRGDPRFRAVESAADPRGA